MQARCKVQGRFRPGVRFKEGQVPGGLVQV